MTRMSRENIQEVAVRRLAAGRYILEERWLCERVKGTSGWRIKDTRMLERDRWKGALRECRVWVDVHGRGDQ